MNSHVYLIICGTILLVFTLNYYLILRYGKNYLFNRIYLLSAGVLSLVFALPEFTFPINHEYLSYTLNTLEISSQVTGGSFLAGSINVESLLWFIYFTGVVFLIATNYFAFVKIKNLIRNGKQMNLGGYNVIVNNKISDSFSFLNMIVVPDKQINSLVLKHEYAHVKGNHAIDLFFAEAICIMLWFVPYIKMYKRAIVMNHEFIADQISSSATSRELYCEQLLAQTMGTSELSLGHTFSNTSLTKTRILMMYKNPSSRIRSTFSYLMIIPVIAISIIIASCKDATQKSHLAEEMKTETNTGPETMPEYPGGNEALMNYLINQIKYPENSKMEGVEGKVFVKFVITSEGKVRDVTVEKGVNDELDAEAVRVVSFMPDWKPGMKNGKNTSTQLTLPIMFSLK